MYKASFFDKLAFILVLIGALAWGIYGIIGINVVYIIFGTITPIIERLIYILVGLSAVDLIWFFFKSSR